jgi:hypothetical protein
MLKLSPKLNPANSNAHFHKHFPLALRRVMEGVQYHRPRGAHQNEKRIYLVSSCIAR